MSTLLKNYKKDFKEKVFLGISKLLNLPFYALDEIYESKLKKEVKRCVLYLPGKGCGWYKKSGGCSICGFNSELEKVNRIKKINNEDLMMLYKIAERATFAMSPFRLTIFNGGSFLNDDEIPLEVQLDIADNFKRHFSFQVMEIESRPEYVKENKIAELVDRAKPKTVQVNIGLECVDDYIRINYINKGFLKEEYERACSVLKNNGAKVLTYVFLKPPFISEKRAIKEAINTVNYVFEQGTGEAALECAFVQKNTQLEKLYKKNEFRPPWLWSIIKVIESISGKGIVRIGDFQDVPPPLAVPYNCDRCSNEIMGLFREYKKTLNIKIFENLTCECKTMWLKELEID